MSFITRCVLINVVLYLANGGAGRLQGLAGDRDSSRAGLTTHRRSGRSFRCASAGDIGTVVVLQAAHS